MTKVVLTEPDNPHALIWRYLSLPKFILLLDNQQLHLTRADLLEDDYEGVLTFANCKALQQTLQDPTNIATKHDNYRRLQKSVFISSWHINEQESYAMWKLYSGKAEGVAIQTTYQALANCYQGSDVLIGAVQYIDYFKESITNNTVYEYFMYKRLFFEYEREVRLIKHLPDILENKGESPEGIDIPVDLAPLIQAIYINPYAPAWYHEAVKSIIKHYYPALLSQLRSSSLRIKPPFINR